MWLIDSDAITPVDQGGFAMRRRHLLLWVSAPKTPDAQITKWELGAMEPLTTPLFGIEPTVTRDGKLMIYQGHPDNSGEIDTLVYTLNDSACAASGWSAPKSISSMHVDPKVVGVYPLAERKLRAADGNSFEDGDLFRGAYPWLMPEGDAVIFAATPMPCASTDNPPGCGPRRNAISVIGYPTNWGLAHVDGGVNPDTDATVRLFFSSPGPTTFSQIPVSPGTDVWPFFGSNTHNYVELVFDDGLDGGYSGFWHLNESVTKDGNLDTARTPDVSGYFNTATLAGGLGFSTKNDGFVGKSLLFDGIDDRLVVDSASSLNPANGITIDFMIQPTANPDCDANNNYRVLFAKGSLADGSYSMVFEEGAALQARVNVGGEQVALASPAIPLDAWSRVTFEYDGPTGKAGFWINDVAAVETTLTPGTITSTNFPLTIGAPGARDACPNGDGAFAGRLDEVSISRYSRHYGEPPIGGPGESGAGEGGAGPSSGPGAGPGAGGGGAGGGESLSDDGGSGCSCHTSESGSKAGWLAAIAAFALFTARRPRSRGKRIASA
ncbi:MAG: LamG domain-containing protein [Myxococcales bacterium]|nr:LamG domain-containing protein [Myxococcales bacterium]